MPTLRWLTRDEDVRATEKVPYRLLEEVPELGYGDRDAGNMLIQSDNLEALKALLPYYAGRVKCIYIDPPYNCGSAFEHYDDNLEHSKWLAMMWPRLELLRELLSEDGSIWVSIDDWEGHYLKVIMDEVFGRANFIANVVWQKKYAPANDEIWLSDNHDHVIGFAKSKAIWRPNKLARSAKSNAAYKNPDDDPRGPWKAGDYTCAKSADERPNLFYAVKNPVTEEEIWSKRTRVWGYGEAEYQRHTDEHRLWWGKTGKNRVPAYKRFLTDVEEDGAVPQTIWLWRDVGHTQDGRKAQIALNAAPFGTPKPEWLMERILEMAASHGELVLDSFLGSCTTAAVAQKMGRRYIGIEMGDHAVTHCAPRLQKVVDGEQGGISTAQNGKGGSGFRFYRLGLPVFAENGSIQPDIRFPVLASHIWFAETGGQWTETKPLTPFLGAHDGYGYALLYNGILGDKSASGGNVLTRKLLATIRAARTDLPAL